jgi:hypothetical protein
MADGRVACHGFNLMPRGAMRAADQRALDAAMLVAERDLEVQDLFAVALEPEMAGLDDAGVHGPDRHLVDLAAFDPEEVADRGPRRSRCTASTTIAPRARAVLFPDLALRMRLRVLGERRIRT